MPATEHFRVIALSSKILPTVTNAVGGADVPAVGRLNRADSLHANYTLGSTSVADSTSRVSVAHTWTRGRWKPTK